MSRHHSHLNTAVTILKAYEGDQPLAIALKHFFKGQKKYGSKDRRQIRHLCYSYFRVANALPLKATWEEKIIYGFFITSSGPSPFIEALKPEWQSKEALAIEEKFEFLGLSTEMVFPSVHSIEASVSKFDFVYGHFKQPKLFARIRGEYKNKVSQQLINASISFEELDSHAISLKNTTQIDKIVSVNKEVVIQDYSSQRVAEYVEEFQKRFHPDVQPEVWDCCAASGGKSILATDVLGRIQLTQSDVRESILRNLKTRMKQAQIHAKRTLCLDLSHPSSVKVLPNFDLIIADVPCSGSGTWGRTPERLAYFEEEEISKYASLQKSITSTITPKIKKGGFLLYITCSVYQQENTEIVEKLQKEDGLVLMEQKVISGMEFGADTMFMALLEKP